MAAQFAAGLTKTAVEGTVSTIISAIGKEKKIKDEVQRDLEFITAEFKVMQAFLNNVVNAGDESEVARIWVRLLRDLAFDVEDWVEFAAHMPKRSAWAWCRRWLFTPSPCLARPPDLDLAAAEMKLLKARVENVSERSMRYNIVPSSDASSSAGGSRSVSNKPASMPTEQTVAGAAVNPDAFRMLRRAWEAAGKPCAMLNLQKIIATEGGHERQVISVWGSTGGDLGTMTSVIREAYCDAHIRQEFRARAWVKLADPFNLHDFLVSLLTQLRKSCSHHHHHGDGDAEAGFQPVQWKDDDDLMKQLLRVMKQEKCLVVLQDVSTVLQWDDINMYLPDYNNGSRIVVSTHDIGMAFMCTGKPYLVSELRRFPDGHALCAFFFRKAPESIDVGKVITCPSVISVWGSSRTKSILVDKAYRSIIGGHHGGLKSKFEKYGWVHVPDNSFDLRLISRQLYLDLCSCGGSAYNNETKRGHETVVDAIEETDLIQECYKFLHQKACLVVIDGLRSTQDWDLFKDKFLSEEIKSCIIVITDEKKVAKHCADRKDGQVHNIKDDPEANVAENLSIRKEKARDWIRTAQIGESHQELALGFSLLLTKYQSDGVLVLPGVVSVWGVAGVGKKHLVRTCYYHHMLRSWGQLFTVNSQHIWLDVRNTENREEEFTAFSWVHVPYPFTLLKFSLRLLRDFYADDVQAMEAAAVRIMQGQDVYEECRKILRRKKYFVVIDGLQSTADWDSIKKAFFPQSVDGCVVVITHEATVARHCQVDETKRVNLKAFQANEAHNHFMKVVWKNKQPNPGEMELSKGILSKCGGLPKIIYALGEYCRPSTDQLKHINHDFIGSLESNDQVFPTLRGLFSWMKYYFDYACSDTLKPCIFYLSIFPVNHNIRQNRLVRRWITEGYCRGKASTTVEEEGEKFLSELINLSILQVQHTPRKILELNGFFREYLISRPMEDDLVFVLKGRCARNSQLAGQHLTIRSNWDRDRAVFEAINFSRLRSLTVSGKWESFFVSANNNMRLLRVLDLENSLGVTNEDLEQIVKLLHRLKFLSLRGCREITRLPDSLGSLRQLHTLDIRYTSISMLPLVIIKLQKLQYISAGTTEPWDLISPSEPPSEDRASTKDGNGTVRSPLVPSPPEAQSEDRVSTEDGNATVRSPQVPSSPEAPSEDRASTEDVTGTLRSPQVPSPPEAPSEDRVSTEDGNATVRSPQVPSPPEASSEDQASTEDGNGTLRCPQVPAKDEVGTSTSSQWSSRARQLANKFPFRHRQPGAHHNGSIEVPAGIGKLTALQALGVVDVSGAGRKVVSKELKKLTQLRKLRVSGISNENYKELFSAISGHAHLESLSVRLDKDQKGDFCSLELKDIAEPPRYLKSLKLYGHVDRLPTWMKDLDRLSKVDLEMTILAELDMRFSEAMPKPNIQGRISVKPVGMSELQVKFSTSKYWNKPLFRVFRIDCTSSLKAVTFTDDYMTFSVELLVVHCSAGESSLQIAGLQHLGFLKEVWLKGSYSHQLWDRLKKQLSEHPAKPVLKPASFLRDVNITVGAELARGCS